MAALRLCLAQWKMFSGKNILRKEKHFLLFDSIVEITLENYFMCLVLHVKNLFLENVSTSQPPLPSTTHHQPPKTQIGKRKKKKKPTTIALLPPKSIKTPPPIPPQQQQNRRSKKKKIRQRRVGGLVQVREKKWDERENVRILTCCA